MQPETLPQLLKKLEKYSYALDSARKLNKLSTEQREAMHHMLQCISLARAQTEFSLADEDFEARNQGFGLAQDQLQLANQAILDASNLGMIGTVEVAHFSSLIETAIELIEKTRKE